MAGNVTITVKGLDEIRAKFGNAHPVVQRELYRAMYRAVTGELGRMPSYPPQPPNSWYTRTGYLGRSLTAVAGSASGAASKVQMAGKNVQGIVGTNVEYAGQVIGPSQGRAFQGRWWQLEPSVMSHKGQIEAEFADAADRIVEELER
jgi:hypothetical protein